MPAFHATQFDAAVAGLILPNGLRLASVKVAFPSPVVQVSPFFLQDGTVAEIEAVIEAADIEAYLNQRQPSGMSNFSVKANGGLLTVVATAKVVIPVQVGAEGTLAFADGRLNFVPRRAEVGGVKMPDGMMREQLNKVNPIIDSTGYPVDVTVKAITIENGTVRLAGSAAVTAPIPRREP